jgi:hypothetical protein
MDPLSLLWIFFILVALQPAVQRYFLVGNCRRRLEASRVHAADRFESGPGWTGNFANALVV